MRSMMQESTEARKRYWARKSKARAGSGHSEAEPGGGKAGLARGKIGISRGKAGPDQQSRAEAKQKAVYLDNNLSQKGKAKVYLDRTGVSGSLFL